jgi:hypothetical protein
MIKTIQEHRKELSVRSARETHDICKCTLFNHIPELDISAMTGVSLTRIDHHTIVTQKNDVCVRLIGTKAMDVFQNI